MSEIRTAIPVTEYQAFGGTFFDSVAHSAMYRDDSPYDFGVMTSRLFASTTMMGMVNKKWTYMTIANKNYYVIPGGKNEYTWSVVGDADIEFRITQLIETAGSQVGKGGQLFEIAIDRNWPERGMVLKTASDNAPLIEVVSERGTPLGAHSWKYTCKLQDGSPNSWISTDYLQPDSLLTRVSTRVPDEENTDYNFDSFASMQKLRSVVGQYANGVKFTDRFIKQELAAAGKGVSNTGSYEDSTGRRYRDAFSRGHIYQADLRNGENKKVKQGMFIPIAESRLLERTEMDRELACEFGRLQVDNHIVSGRVKKTAPGWRQIVRDGQYMPHGGGFTLQQLYDFLHQVFFRRRGFMNREPYLCGGTGAITYLSNLIAAQANNSLAQNTAQNQFSGVRPAGEKTGVHKYEYEWGYQFTRILFPQGITVNIMYDPLKDDDRYFKEMAPGTNLPLESFQIDILDFGKTENAGENASGENITMVMQDNSDYYFSVSNAIDFKKGVVRDGSNVHRFGKNLEIYREMSGSLGVWDVKAVGRIEWVVGYNG